MLVRDRNDSQSQVSNEKSIVVLIPTEEHKIPSCKS